MNIYIFFVLIITSITSTDCIECVWETRFCPRITTEFHYPRTRSSDWNMVAMLSLLKSQVQMRRNQIKNAQQFDTRILPVARFLRFLRQKLSRTHQIGDEEITIEPNTNSSFLPINISTIYLNDSSKTESNASTFQLHDNAGHTNSTRSFKNSSQGDIAHQTSTNLKYGKMNTTIFRKKMAHLLNDDGKALQIMLKDFKNVVYDNTNKYFNFSNCDNKFDDCESLEDGGLQAVLVDRNITQAQDDGTNYVAASSSISSDLAGDDPNHTTTLHIPGLFAMTGEYPAGVGYLPAALLAIRLINNNRSILPNYKLQLNVHDTRCSQEWGLDALYTELYNQSRTSIMSLGTTCSHVTESTAMVSHIWGMVQISYSAVSPHLSTKHNFPSFFRVTTPEQILTTSRIYMFKAMNWTRVHIVYQNFKLFSTLNEFMIKDLKDSNITVVSSNMFTSDPYNSVRRLKEADARIVIGSFYEDMARKVMCAAYSLPEGDQWYKNVVWFLPSFLDRGWMEVPYLNCSSANIRQVVGKYFTFGSIQYNPDPSYHALGNVSQALFEDYNLYNETKDDIPEEFRHLYSHCNLSVQDCSLYAVHRAPEAYDAIWAIALALDNTLKYLNHTGDSRRLEHFDYGKHHPDLSCIIREAMRNVTFPALSGNFRFNANGEGTSNVAIHRYLDTWPSVFIQVGNCSSDLEGHQWTCSIQEDKIQWDTVNGKPPYDGIQTRMRPIKVELGVWTTFFSLAWIGILVSCCLLIFNIWNRNHRIIKTSSPRINNLILIGSILGYVDIVLQDDGNQRELTVCKIRLFAKPLSFCLMFGSLFAKTWRVYQIFTAGAQAYKLNKKILRDSSLFLIVAGLVAITCTTLVSWMVISPQEAVTANISLTEAHELSDLDVDIVYVNQFHHCDSKLQREFTIGLAVLQGLMMIFGTFLAVQIRKVSYPEFNDSKLIAMAIYNVVIVEPVGRIMTWAINDKPELRYELYSLMQITMISVTLGLLFVPKIISYRRHNKKNGKSSEQMTTSSLHRVSHRTTTDSNHIHSGDDAKKQQFSTRHSNRQDSIINIISSPKVTATFPDLNETLGLGKPDQNFLKNNSTNEHDTDNDQSMADGFIYLEPVKAPERKRKLVSRNTLSPLTNENHFVSKANRSILFKRSFSDTNLWSVLQQGEKEEDAKAAPKPGMIGHFASIYRDNEIIQEVKIKAGVKVKARSGNMDLKASWKEKRYTKNNDTTNKIDLILE